MNKTSSQETKLVTHWKVALVCFALLFGVVVTVPWHIKWWPSGYMKNHVRLWQLQDEIREILILAEKTPYDRIFWVDSIPPDSSSEPHTLLVDIYDTVQEKFVQVENPDTGALIKFAQEAQIPMFMLINFEGTWGIETYQDSWVHSSGEKHVQVLSFYQYGGPAIGERCSKRLIESSDFGRCHTKLFGDWIMRKSWFWIETSGW